MGNTNQKTITGFSLDERKRSFLKCHNIKMNPTVEKILFNSGYADDLNERILRVEDGNIKMNLHQGYAAAFKSVLSAIALNKYYERDVRKKVLKIRDRMAKIENKMAIRTNSPIQNV